MPDEPEAQDSPAEEAVESSTANGYCVELYVYADGTYGVEGPEAIESEADEASETHLSEGGSEKAKYPTLAEALKAILTTVKSNPLGDTEQANFEAGYKA